MLKQMCAYEHVEHLSRGFVSHSRCSGPKRGSGWWARRAQAGRDTIKRDPRLEPDTAVPSVSSPSVTTGPDGSSSSWCLTPVATSCCVSGMEEQVGRLVCRACETDVASSNRETIYY